MDRSDIKLERMRTFVRVAERGSLSAVARELGIGQSTVTRHLRELEEAVGVPLLSRTTRRVPQDLSGHEGIRMSNVAGSEIIVLQGPGGERHAVPFGGRFRIDHGLAAREALVAGRGIAPAHRWLVDDLLAAGRLKAILPDYTLPSVPLSMLIVPERAGIARVRLLIDFLAEEIGRIPGIERPRPER